MSADAGYHLTDYAKPSVEQINLLTSHPAIAADLPSPDSDLRRVELCDRWSHATVSKLTTHGILQKRRSLWDDDSEDGKGHLWHVDADVFAWVQDNIDDPATCPDDDCFATGVRNLGGGQFTCSSDDCDREFDRATALEVLGR